jgi:cell division protein FtsA
VSARSNRQPGDIVGVLDLGTSKTVCLIVWVPPNRNLDGLRVLGVGHQPSRGLKAGVVVELDAAEQSVRAAVTQAERLAGVGLESVVVAVACGRLKSSTFVASTEIEGRVVSEADMTRVMEAGRTYTEREGRTLLHLNAVTYRLDGAAGLPDPRGLAGRKLAADLHAVTVDDPPLRNLLHVVERAYLSACGLVPAPYASGLAATTPEERQHGVIAIDLGAGTTSLAAFFEGHLLLNDVVPVGGNHVSFDIARSLQTSVVEAERIKTLCGRVGPGAPDDHELVSYTLAAEEVPALCQATRGRIREIVNGRLMGLFGQVAERIQRSGVLRYGLQRMVLTGGGSQLAGLLELATDAFGRPARVAWMQALPGASAEPSGPGFSAASGLVRVALDPTAGIRSKGREIHASTYLRRMGQWLRESF